MTSLVICVACSVVCFILGFATNEVLRMRSGEDKKMPFKEDIYA